MKVALIVSIPREKQTYVPAAYERLAQHGALDWFSNDKFSLSAIILEYIPGVRKFWIDTYSKERAKGFLRVVQEIHKAGILRDAPHPRNMVFDSDPKI
ncbi:hypothetical protein EYZ11_000126 [Aspergillus tanneri]|uniref:Protein kinase domain-containing protein n=1 Tax=Aspergillus tanneri TaxID=1220188 RepID=A0A4S3JXX6_9EURO|nr:hypothetical protein EYZ11_000126 [Aspergillus tanneri]